MAKNKSLAQITLSAERIESIIQLKTRNKRMAIKAIAEKLNIDRTQVSLVLKNKNTQLKRIQSLAPSTQLPEEETLLSLTHQQANSGQTDFMQMEMHLNGVTPLSPTDDQYSSNGSYTSEDKQNQSIKNIDLLDDHFDADTKHGGDNDSTSMEIKFNGVTTLPPTHKQYSSNGLEDAQSLGGGGDDFEEKEQFTPKQTQAVSSEISEYSSKRSEDAQSQGGGRDDFEEMEQFTPEQTEPDSFEISEYIDSSIHFIGYVRKLHSQNEFLMNTVAALNVENTRLNNDLNAANQRYQVAFASVIKEKEQLENKLADAMAQKQQLIKQKAIVEASQNENNNQCVACQKKLVFTVGKMVVCRSCSDELKSQFTVNNTPANKNAV